ncbi:MAG: hypothetical protein CM15mP128_1080 [Methanobacteriota archaeon]|nr:MAG: hypothetical protein CM15mP128_1080 [Euryarchaeota archaeon]
MVKDVIGREWQLGTVQVDYNLPERFDLTYKEAMARCVPTRDDSPRTLRVDAASSRAHRTYFAGMCPFTGFRPREVSHADHLREARRVARPNLGGWIRARLGVRVQVTTATTPSAKQLRTHLAVPPPTCSSSASPKWKGGT